eukprot:CAMPEP_0203929996 /NCGR_PEP_ID=MMETSP0359-20131031/68817_1 /ASSEMBLY_ACC=CAM_ASM_000338 /TAXON_ID=268821 /ORGANISM="Scrippsiella Hangoei, Strain SHTV-5" /LENGTH=86 /DNA_ID=CAMNT_0050859109 /DNA_START=67 /DNA_END=324 /DNA_ORIENTATION=-
MFLRGALLLPIVDPVLLVLGALVLDLVKLHALRLFLEFADRFRTLVLLTAVEVSHQPPLSSCGHHTQQQLGSSVALVLGPPSPGED